MNEPKSLQRRDWLLAAPAVLLTLPACSISEDEKRAQAGLPPLTPEQRRLRHKFRNLDGGQLVVDGFGRKEAVTIFDEQGRVFFTSSVVSPKNKSFQSYSAEFGVPVTLRAVWRRDGEEVGGVVQNPIVGKWAHGIYEGGIIEGDYTVPVAERIPEALLEEHRTKHGSFRLKLRLHDDGLLVGWDLKYILPTYQAGGDFREADIENGVAIRKGWYIHPKTGQRIETDF